jgi:hypothetical protein
MTRALLAGLVLLGSAAPEAATPAPVAGPQRLASAAPGEALELPPELSRLLERPAWGSTPGPFRLIALSSIADGCAGQALARPGREAAARACVLRALELARAELPDPGQSRDGLRLTHLSLILGAADELGPCPDEALHRQLAQTLARWSLADPHAHAPSYGSSSLRWPADQAATLASLRRFDLAHQGQLTDRPLERWREAVAAAMDAPRELPRSEVTGRGVGARYARGCAQSYLGRYLPEVDPALAATWWRAYVRQFLVWRGPVPGFREWPPGVEGRADDDSGPIVLGVGAAASAFGIAAAKAQGDAALGAQLEAGADLVLGVGVGGAAAHSALAEAIRFEARWQPALAGRAKGKRRPRRSC